MKIDCFIMNPPYNSGDGGVGKKKTNKLKEMHFLVGKL